MVTDEERAMAMLAEANPIPDEGSLELIPGPTAHFVVPIQRSSETMDVRDDQMERQNRPAKGIRVFGIAAAAIVAVVGIVALVISQMGESAPIVTNPPSTTLASEGLSLEEQEEAVRTLINARDVETLRSAVSAGWIESHTPPDAEDPERTFDEFWTSFLEAQQILGIERELQGCDQIDDTSAQCTIGYSDNMTDALGQWPLVTSTPFSFVDGKIDMGDPTDNFLTAYERFQSYANAVGIQAEVQENCPVGPFEPDCATFVIDNLEEWVAWEEANG